MKKKMLGVLLSAAMVMTMLVGCGGGSSDSGDTAEQEATEAPAEDGTGDAG